MDLLTITLADLLELVEKSPGPDGELDKILWYKLILDPALDDESDDEWLRLIGSKRPPFTYSIDGALALLSRVLPDWPYRLYSHYYVAGVYQGGPGAQLFSPISSAVTSDASAATLPLAIIAALLKGILRNLESKHEVD